MTDAASVERGIRELGASQRTMVTHEQLLACGLGSRAIAYRRRTGQLKVVFPGVYSIGCHALPPLAIEQAALLACGEGSFLCDLTSAAIWGLVPRLPDQPHISVVGRYFRPRAGLCVHLLSAVDRRELRRRDGLLVSSPARVVLELAATASSDVVESALDEASGKRLVSSREVEAVLARHPRSRGSARLRDLIDPEKNRGMTRSRAERRFRALVRKAGLPQPEVNERLGPFTVDFLWRAERLIVEIDGYEFHRGRGTFESDRARDAALKAAGWEVVRFTWIQLRDQPELVLFRLGQIIGALSRLGRAAS